MTTEVEEITKAQRIVAFAKENPDVTNGAISRQFKCSVGYVSNVLSRELPKRKAQKRKASKGAAVVRRIIKNPEIDRVALAEAEGVTLAYASQAIYWTHLALEQL